MNPRAFRAACLVISPFSRGGYVCSQTFDHTSLLRFIETRDVMLSASRVLTPAAVFLQVDGGASGGIVIDGGDLTRAASAISFAAGARQDAVKLK